MIYNRGNPMDFDGWAENGLPSWSFAHCLPYFRKMETFSGGGDTWRGSDGPMKISRCKAEHKLYDAFLRGGEQAGFTVTDDHNGYKQEGLHVAQAYIHNGYRWSTSRGYLRPAQTRENLSILSKALVNRILIDKGVAVGVEVDDHGTPRRIMCEREVILCAGAFNSPQLLMLSGIGDARELATHGITAKADVPAIGQNLENHPAGPRSERVPEGSARACGGTDRFVYDACDHGIFFRPSRFSGVDRKADPAFPALHGAA